MKNKTLKSLNKELPQFFLEELEQRLETDPLSIGGLFDLQEADGDDGICIGNSNCQQKGDCTENSNCSVFIN